MARNWCPPVCFRYALRFSTMIYENILKWCLAAAANTNTYRDNMEARKNDKKVV